MDLQNINPLFNPILFSESKNYKTIEIIRFKFVKKRIVEIPKNNLPLIHSRLYNLLEVGIIRNIGMGIYRLNKGISNRIDLDIIELPNCYMV